MKFELYSGELQMAADSLATHQVVDWGVNVIQAPLVWQQARGEGIRVAVLDTGICKQHPDLVANIKGGVNFTTSDPGDFEDRQGHGSHCGGIIAGVDNGIGVIGVAPGAELYSVKVLGDDGQGGIDAIIKGLNWAVENKMDVVSMSLGCGEDPGVELHQAIQQAHAAGIVIVAASGNESTKTGYPAAYPECIAVGAVDPALDAATFSNFGSEVDIAAPGVDILSTYKDGGYARLSGTSMATPMVAGVVALILSLSRKQGVHPTADQITQMINQRSVHIGTGNAHDDHYGSGLINLYKLLK